MRAAETAPADPADITGQEWSPLGKYVPALAINLTPATKGQVRFKSDGTWTGFDGCNRAGGRYTLTSEVITMTGGALTDIGCRNFSPESVLNGAKLLVNESGTHLTATDISGAVVVEYQR